MVEWEVVECLVAVEVEVLKVLAALGFAVEEVLGVVEVG